MSSRGEGDAARLDPLGALLRHALLPDHPAADALRLALELARTLVQRAHDPVPDADEVLHEIELRLAARRKVDLVWIGDLDRALPDLKLHERRRHSRSIPVRWRCAEGWQSGRMRRSRKPLDVVRRLEGSNPSPSVRDVTRRRRVTRFTGETMFPPWAPLLLGSRRSRGVPAARRRCWRRGRSTPLM